MFKETLMEALGKTVAIYNATQDPDAAVVKVASDMDFNMDQAQRLVEVFNTAHSLHHYKMAEDKLAPFKLARLDTVLGQLFDTTCQTAPSVKVAAARLISHSEYDMPQMAIEAEVVPVPMAKTAEVNRMDPNALMHLINRKLLGIDQVLGECKIASIVLQDAYRDAVYEMSRTLKRMPAKVAGDLLSKAAMLACEKFGDPGAKFVCDVAEVSPDFPLSKAANIIDEVDILPLWPSIVDGVTSVSDMDEIATQQDQLSKQAEELRETLRELAGCPRRSDNPVPFFFGKLAQLITYDPNNPPPGDPAHDPYKTSRQPPRATSVTPGASEEELAIQQEYRNQARELRDIETHSQARDEATAKEEAHQFTMSDRDRQYRLQRQNLLGNLLSQRSSSRQHAEDLAQSNAQHIDRMQAESDKNLLSDAQFQLKYDMDKERFDQQMAQQDRMEADRIALSENEFQLKYQMSKDEFKLKADQAREQQSQFAQTRTDRIEQDKLKKEREDAAAARDNARLEMETARHNKMMASDSTFKTIGKAMGEGVVGKDWSNVRTTVEDVLFGGQKERIEGMRGALEQQQDFVERASMLQDILISDPVLSSEDPRKIARLYEGLMRIAPNMSKQPEVARSILRAASQSVASDAYDAKTWVDIERLLTDIIEGRPEPVPTTIVNVTAEKPKTNTMRA